MPAKKKKSKYFSKPVNTTLPENFKVKYVYEKQYGTKYQLKKPRGK